MCRNIKNLHNFEPPASPDETRDAALQFVRKISGYRNPSKTNETCFWKAVDEVDSSIRELLESLTTSAPKRDRVREAEKAKQRSLRRFGK